MTNTSLEKSLDESMNTEPIEETRIKPSPKKSLDLIKAYRETIIQRYTEKMLQEDPKQVIKLSDEKPLHHASPMPTCISEQNNVYKKKLHVPEPEVDISSERKRQSPMNRSPVDRKRPKSCRKIDRDQFLDKDHSTVKKLNHNHKASLDTSIIVGLAVNKNRPRSSTKLKAPIRRHVENVTSSLKIGDFVKLYKTRRPSSEDLNVARMILVLVYSNYIAQLFKINVGSAEDCARLSWKSLKSFLETNSNKIFKLLKSFPRRYFGDEKEQLLNTLEILNNLKQQYKTRPDDILRKYVDTLNKLYLNHIKKQARTYEGIKKVTPFDAQNLFNATYQKYPEIKVNENMISEVLDRDNFNSTVPDIASVVQKIEFHPPEVQEDEIIDSSTQKDHQNTQYQTHTSNISREPTPEPREYLMEDPIFNEDPELQNYNLPLSPIEEQLARNEESKESLKENAAKAIQDLQTKAEIKVTKEDTREDNEEIEDARPNPPAQQPKPVLEELPSKAKPRKTSVNKTRHKRYDTAVLSRQIREFKPLSSRENSMHKSIDRSKR